MPIRRMGASIPLRRVRKRRITRATKLSRWEMTRIDNTTFTVESFAKVSDKTPTYTASCKRN